jgi:ubiquinone/menaquinone biosynthesis C-methylase UbiE
MLKFIIGSNYPNHSKEDFSIGSIENLPYENGQFGYIICSAVLHFAKSEVNFWTMFNELDRVLQPNGALFIRMTSDIGLTGHSHLKDGVYDLPDGSQRFLLNASFIDEIIANKGYSKTEPIKTVLVDDLRCMTTLVLKKEG